MRFFPLRGAAALALALSVTACGGGKATFTLEGTVQNLKYPGLVLATNGMDVSVAPPTTPGGDVHYSFPNQLEYGDVYDVIVKSQPAHQTCGAPSQDDPSGPHRPVNGKDTAGRLTSIDIFLSCVDNSYTIGGTVSGLTADGLVLANGSTAMTASVPKNATAYVFPQTVVYNQTYGVTVLTQPAGLFCTVANAAGTMGDAKVDNIAVTCVPRT